MNEAETRAELIDPMLRESGWGVVEGSKVLREFHITAGKIQAGGRAKPVIADYILVYKGIKLAVIEAKSDELEVGEGVAQAKDYALKLKLDYTYSSNGKQIYEMRIKNGNEGLVASFPTPDELWNRIFSDQNEWRDKFNSVPFEDVGGTKSPRYYQEIAINKTVSAVAEEKPRILLTLATGTGKTFIAFQIAWKLFQTRWNIKRDGSRRPRILFLADRNILADQAFNAFSAFPEDALVRINPKEIGKKGRVPTNGNIFFTIFQTFMSGKDKKPYFGDYPPDYFDFIIIDECHRGGANDESSWRDILEYFRTAVQLGLTATPKRKYNADTYEYFGKPIYEYSLKEGINDGFLTPFKVKRIKTTVDDYMYTSDDDVLEGEVEEGKLYTEGDFNRIIEIQEREAYRVKTFLETVNQTEKSIVFCANQPHAALVRDFINKYGESKDPSYCVRVTANDGALGELHLRDFQDNEKTIPTILTTSKKLSTGVDARNVRNVVLMRPVKSMIEFKQIIGRGTRLYEGKEFFTIYDFVDAYVNFSDPEWDGPPLDPEPPKPRAPKPPGGTTDPDGTDDGTDDPPEQKKKIKIKLRDGKEREIQHTVATSFWSADGKPISAEEFLQNLYGTLPDYFKSEEELREIWSNPKTRKAFLEKLADAGYGKDELSALQSLINANNSDLFDVLEFVSYAIKPISREERVAKARSSIFKDLDDKEQEFLDFVLSKYVETGYEELDQEKLPRLLELKYHSISDAVEVLGGVSKIQETFTSFQKALYQQEAS
ncbi:EcoAI/FtnUII family type I restriction enzme subunit R [Alkalihalobacterium chitinilyticum]|uniref:DEAD/DEAH box helicase family protein n=1 Tax=Alkalihalobacterium chitinilyticum TaxID=2980103 RepID=A0ABT5VJU3_9BACI|nr:type I restriction endonuclease subunit R [Alkalihalobacterium chitinilyticum]MDE5415471.1 DEAD/DEAH box helicase family protein [Alkalihalobacterium chitinilyticum]